VKRIDARGPRFGEQRAFATLHPFSISRNANSPTQKTIVNTNFYSQNSHSTHMYTHTHRGTIHTRFARRQVLVQIGASLDLGRLTSPALRRFRSCVSTTAIVQVLRSSGCNMAKSVKVIWAAVVGACFVESITLVSSSFCYNRH
jgi:hypothetical protein